MKKTSAKPSAPKAGAKPSAAIPKPATAPVKGRVAPGKAATKVAADRAALPAVPATPPARAAAKAAPAKAAAGAAKPPGVALKTPPARAKTKPVSSPKPVATVISAKIDIGVGNYLFLRGVGPGLSWDRGQAMQCVGPGLWALTIHDAALPIPFKVLVNDMYWSMGSDFVAAPGSELTVVPEF